MKPLRDILPKVTWKQLVGSIEIAINKVAFDSREIVKNDVFVAIRGVSVDGHNYIDNAISQGATVIVCEVLPAHLVSKITYLQVACASTALAMMASDYYENPSEKLQLIGVTGTNGKTTVASLLYQLFRNTGHRVGLISTVALKINEVTYPATHTTPDVLQTNKLLRQMLQAGVTFCFMEVSSHGIHQKRTAGLLFSGGIFTNLSHDHLDYHSTFAAYRDLKKQFFDELPSKAFALVNADDKNGAFMLQNTKARRFHYALKTHADYTAQILENRFEGLLMRIGDQELWTQLIGAFNAYNLLAVYAVAVLLELKSTEVLRQISHLKSVSGRFQYFISKEKITIIVDYAHTPDALKNVLETINSIRTQQETLLTVVGCGGNRDTSKRPKMGQIAAMLSSKVIFTSDNPRHESPEGIIHAMETGVPSQYLKKIIAITDRKQAIKTACQMAASKDIILIAGKGHETYQEIQGKRYEFDDYKIVKDALEQLEK